MGVDWGVWSVDWFGGPFLPVIGKC